MTADLSAIGYLAPIWGFVLVFALIYAILAKTKIIGESKWTNSIVSLIVGIIFLTVSDVNKWVTDMVPWISVMIIIVFFFLLLVFFMMKEPDKFVKPGFAWFFFAVLAIIILFTAGHAFNFNIVNYMPWNSGFSTKIWDNVLFIAIALVVGIVITRK